MSEISNIRIVEPLVGGLSGPRVCFTIRGHEAVVFFAGPNAEERAKAFAESLKS